MAGMYDAITMPLLEEDPFSELVQHNTTVSLKFLPIPYAIYAVILMLVLLIILLLRNFLLFRFSIQHCSSFAW